MLQVARSLGDQNLRAEAHYDLAMDALSAGEIASAQPHLAVAVQHYRNLNHLDGLARCLGALSALALAREHAGLAARLIGAAAAGRVRLLVLAEGELGCAGLLAGVAGCRLAWWVPIRWEPRARSRGRRWPSGRRTGVFGCS